MVIPSDPFHQLLEHYVFGVASKFIQLAGTDEQNQLIDLINLVNADIESSPDTATPALAKEKEESILAEPTELVSADDHWLIISVQRQAQRQKAYIQHLEKAISTTETQAQLISRQFHAEPSRSALLERNKHILDIYQRHLAETKDNQRTLYHQLSKLTTRLYPGNK